eukprot:RCo046664
MFHDSQQTLCNSLLWAPPPLLTPQPQITPPSAVFSAGHCTLLIRLWTPSPPSPPFQFFSHSHSHLPVLLLCSRTSLCFPQIRLRLVNCLRSAASPVASSPPSFPRSPSFSFPLPPIPHPHEVGGFPAAFHFLHTLYLAIFFSPSLPTCFFPSETHFLFRSHTHPVWSLRFSEGKSPPPCPPMSAYVSPRAGRRILLRECATCPGTVKTNGVGVGE